MRLVVVSLLLTFTGCASPQPELPALRVVPLGTTPEDLAVRLRDKTLPEEDYRRLGITNDLTDIRVRFVQLDEDPAWEAVFVAVDLTGMNYEVRVFDRSQSSWNIVGAFNCFKHCAATELVQVQRLAPKSPKFLILHQDLGGSGMTLWTTYVYGLKNGRLLPVMEFQDLHNMPSGFEPFTTRRNLFTDHEEQLVIHTQKETEGAKKVTHSCESFVWNQVRFQFVKPPKDKASPCDAKTGQPIKDKVNPVDALR